MLGEHVSQTGVPLYNPTNDNVAYKNHYQWVPFMLFLQVVMFYVPQIRKFMEKGLQTQNVPFNLILSSLLS